jgi:hypothetical protein
LGTGFQGVYSKSRDGSWIRATSQAYVPDVFGGAAVSATLDGVPRSMLVSAAAKADPAEIATATTKQAAYAAKRITSGVHTRISTFMMYNEGLQSLVTPGLIVCGMFLDESGLQQRVFQAGLVLIAIIIGINFVSTYVAVSFFMLPLER